MEISGSICTNTKSFDQIKPLSWILSVKFVKYIIMFEGVQELPGNSVLLSHIMSVIYKAVAIDDMLIFSQNYF